MFELTDPNNNTPQVVILSGGSLGGATTTLKIQRVLNAVNINSSGGLVFQFANSDIDERAFYDNFFWSVSQYDENAAKPQALYFMGVLAENPNAFTLEEIAFLAKTMIYPNWTSPVLMSWAQWENICRTNTVAFATLFSQLTPTGQTPTGTTPNDPQLPTQPTTPSNGNTGTGLPDVKTDTGLQQLFSSIPTGFWWSIAGGVLVYFITRSISKR